VESFRYQAECQNRLAMQGIPCPRVIPDREGCYGRRRGAAFWAVHDYVDGLVYDWADWHTAKARPGFLEGVGRQVARVHDVLAEASIPGDPALSSTLPPVQFRLLDRIQEQWEEDLDRLAGGRHGDSSESTATLLGLRARICSHWLVLRNDVECLGVLTLPTQPVHGDVSPVNMVFPNGRAGFTLIDWDCLHEGLRAYDALGDVLNRRPLDAANAPRFDWAEVRRYLRGYRQGSRRPWTPLELDAVPAFCRARQLEDLRQRLHVLPHLAAADDATYAGLIARRVEVLEQIQATAEEGWFAAREHLELSQ
jgi:Ser/Thr protein kinase RdoA (MazF antagonist)